MSHTHPVYLGMCRTARAASMFSFKISIESWEAIYAFLLGASSLLGTRLAVFSQEASISSSVPRRHLEIVRLFPRVVPAVQFFQRMIGAQPMVQVLSYN